MKVTLVTFCTNCLEHVYEFYIDAENRAIVKKIPNSEALDTVYNTTSIYDKKNSVILVELEESDIDPTSHIPTIFTASSRNYEKIFKTLCKAGITVFLCDPSSPNQLKEQVKSFRLLSEDSGEFKTLTLPQCIEIIEERLRIVGPISRDVLSNHHFWIRKHKIDNNLFFDALAFVNVKNVVGNTHYFIAPFFKQGATEPLYVSRMQDSSNTYTYEFLSPYCINAIVSGVKSAEAVEKISILNSRLKIDYRIAHGIMIQALLEKPTALYYNFPEKCARHNWIIHKDPGYNKEISSDTLLSKHDTIAILNGTLMPWASKEQIFPGTYCVQDVTTLDERVVYRSRTRGETCFYDCFMVNHGTKEIWFFQAMLTNPANVPITVTTIRTVMEKLNMFDNIGMEYKLVILVFTDKMRNINHGCTFVYEQKNKFGDANDPFTLLDLQQSSQLASDIMTRVKSYVILSVYYPHLQDENDNVMSRFKGYY